MIMSVKLLVYKLCKALCTTSTCRKQMHQVMWSNIVRPRVGGKVHLCSCMYLKCCSFSSKLLLECGTLSSQYIRVDAHQFPSRNRSTALCSVFTRLINICHVPQWASSKKPYTNKSSLIFVRTQSIIL